jgi:hypothetical protein
MPSTPRPTGAEGKGSPDCDETEGMRQLFLSSLLRQPAGCCGKDQSLVLTQCPPTQLNTPDAQSTPSLMLPIDKHVHRYSTATPAATSAIYQSTGIPSKAGLAPASTDQSLLLLMMMILDCCPAILLQHVCAKMS